MIGVVMSPLVTFRQASARGLGIVRKERQLGKWWAALVGVAVLLCVWHFATSGCLPVDGCQIAALSGSDLIAMLLALSAVGWSIGIAIAQREQSDFLRGFARAEQRFSDDFETQMAKLDEHFSVVPATGQSLELQIYVSGPAFGILTKGAGLEHFANILKRFVKAAVARARLDLPSRLVLFFWDRDQHKNIFTWKAQDRKEFWEATDDQWNEIITRVAEICTLLSTIHDTNVNCSSEDDGSGPTQRDLIQVFLFDVPEHECRFFLLDTGTSKKAAMITMAPIAIEKHSDLYSVLLLDNTTGGVGEMKRFVTAFTKRATEGAQAYPNALQAGARACADPRKLFEDYFEYDFALGKDRPTLPAA